MSNPFHLPSYFPLFSLTFRFAVHRPAWARKQEECLTVIKLVQKCSRTMQLLFCQELSCLRQSLYVCWIFAVFFFFSSSSSSFLFFILIGQEHTLRDSVVGLIHPTNPRVSFHGLFLWMECVDGSQIRGESISLVFSTRVIYYGVTGSWLVTVYEPHHWLSNISIKMQFYL